MIPDIKDSVEVNGRLIDQKPAYNRMMDDKVAIQIDEKVFVGQVKQRLLVPENKIVGRYNAKPMLKSMIYELELPDCQLKDYAENVVAKNMLSQVDDEGYSVTLANSILDYKRYYSEVYKDYKYCFARRGKRRIIKMA